MFYNLKLLDMKHYLLNQIKNEQKKVTYANAQHESKIEHCSKSMSLSKLIKQGFLCALRVITIENARCLNLLN